MERIILTPFRFLFLVHRHVHESLSNVLYKWPYICFVTIYFYNATFSGLCDGPCLNNGECLQENKCQCQGGYKGPHCEIKRKSETTDSAYMKQMSCDM